MEELKRAVIREEYVALTGDFQEAIILNQFIYWSQRIKNFDNFIKEENERIEKYEVDGTELQLTEGWIYKTAQQLKEECMLITRKKIRGKEGVESKYITDGVVRECLKNLVSNGWLDQRNNPKYGYDRTLQYRVNLYKITQDLFQLDYMLQGYKVPLNEWYQHFQKTKMQTQKNENAISKNENETSNNENETSNNEKQYHRLPIEITPNTTTKEKEEESSSDSSPLENEFYKIIKTKISEVAFNTWIKSFIIKFDDVIIITFKYEHSRNIIRDRYIDLLQDTFTEMKYKYLEFKLEIDENMIPPNELHLKAI